MTKTKTILIGLALSAIFLASCAGVKFEYSNPEHLNMRLSEVPERLLMSNLVQNEEGQGIFQPPLKVGEFLIYMMASEPMERHSWFNMYVAAKEEGSVITIKKYTRGNLVLVNTINTTYQNGYTESRVDSIVWDDRRTGEKVELTTADEKLGYSLLVTALFVLQ